MPLSDSNLTASVQGEILVALFDDAASSGVPLLLLESFMMGTEDNHYPLSKAG